MGTDERSILLLLMKGQNTYLKKKHRTPAGLRINLSSAEETLSQLVSKDTLLVVPGKNNTWQNTASSFNHIVMYCPLSGMPIPQWMTSFNDYHYHDYHRRDLAILEILHKLDLINWAKEK
jgi:hypothetical protein